MTTECPVRHLHAGPPRRVTRRAVTSLLIGLALAGSGCNSSRDGSKPSPVQGRLTVKDQPAGGAMIVFHPVSGLGVKASAKTNPNGEFRLTTYSTDDGAVAGEYAVTIVWPDAGRTIGDGTDEGVDRLNGKYRDPSKPFTTVTLGPVVKEPILLTVK